MSHIIPQPSLSRNPCPEPVEESKVEGMDVKQVAERPGWDRLRAVKAGRIRCFPEELYGRPGPRLVEGLERLAQIVHPELFIQVPVAPY